MGDIRAGKVSSVEYETGMVKVTYPDKNNEVTASLSLLSYGGEYSMPCIGDNVIVLHLSNGSSRGVVLGGMWNKGSLPTEAKEGLYRKDLSKTEGRSYLRYDDSNGELTIKADEIILQDAGHRISLSELIERIEKLERYTTG